MIDPYRGAGDDDEGPDGEGGHGGVGHCEKNKC
jgi:hypothetical protein